MNCANGSVRRFAGSRTKLSRAAKFITDLEENLNLYNSTALNEAILDTTVNSLEVRVAWKGLGLYAGAILGDAIHNMRAALDLMACELARINNKSDHGVYFPFAGSADELHRQITEKKFERAGADAVLLLTKFKPYKGGCTKLRAIHDLDIADKHRNILETEKRINLKLQFQYEVDDLNNHSITLEGSTIEHFFEKNSNLAGLPIIATLRDLMNMVERILLAFDELVTKRVS